MSRTILVADDSPTIRKIVELTFTDTDIRVEVADSGNAALSRLEEVRPDLVLADVVMPDPTGYELCRLIKTSTNPVPVVLLAGTFEPFDDELARECGADAHLVKPFESETLVEKVRTLLEPPAPPPVATEEPPELEDEAEVAGDLSEDEGEVVVTSEEGSEAAVDGESVPSLDAGTLTISHELVEAVAEAVVRRLPPELLREVARDVVPRLATEIIRERIRELEQEELEQEEQD